MRFFVVTGVYWPDTASVAQHLTDLCTDLAELGHEVTVLTSRYAYEDPSNAYPTLEEYRGVKIHRIVSTRFDKSKIIYRLLNFLSFNLLSLSSLVRVKPNQYDAIIGLTVPPLVSFFGILAAQRTGTPFIYWAMDMQPELAIASGMMRSESVVARIMTVMGNYILNHSRGVVALDRFMASHIAARAGRSDHVAAVPVWPVMSTVYKGAPEDNPFRKAHGFGDKIVVMYSGNHSYVHPLDTWLDAALLLKDDPRFLFVSIGAGVRVKDVESFKERHTLTNIVRLPFQPRETIHLSLGAADIQTVVLGDGQVGYTHPNKVYGAMFIGRPIVYIGPDPSHVTDIAVDCPGNLSVAHGEAEKLANQLREFAQLNSERRIAIGLQNQHYAEQHLRPEVLRKQMTDVVLGFSKSAT
jgi:glycosyltransferase involved in cell wall biosynthesis